MSNSSVSIEVAAASNYVFANANYADVVVYPTYESQRILLGTKSNVNAGLLVSSSNISMTLQPSSSNNSFSFYGGNSNLVATILSSGNVGIGKTFPAYPLDVVGNINFTGALMQNGSAYIGSQWSNNGSNIFITGSNVGIGKNAPQFQLDVGGDINFSGILRQNGSAYIGSQWSNNGSNIFITGSNVGIGKNAPQFQLDVGGDINFSGILRQNGSAYIGSQWSNNSSNLFILGSNVGIGTATPQQLLHVAGNLQVDSNLILATKISMQGLVISRNTGGGAANVSTVVTSVPGYGYNSNVVVNSFNSNYPISFQIGSNEYARVNGNGNVGIGKTNPAYPLDVVGNINFTGALMQNGSAYIGSQWSNNSSNIFITGSNVGIGSATPQALLNVKLGTIPDSTTQPSGTFAAIVYTASNVSGMNGLFVKNNWAAETSTVLEVGNDYVGGAYNSYYHLTGQGNHYLSTQVKANLFCVSNTSVGIGTQSPAYPLDVAGTINTSGSVQYGSAGGECYLKTAGQAHLWANSTGQASYIHMCYSVGSNGSTGDHIFCTQGDVVLGGGVERMRILSGGNMGIGTSSPGYKLDVAGNIKVSGVSTYGTIKIGPATSSNETSIGFYTNSDMSGSATQAGAAWVLGQASYGVGAGNFGLGTASAGIVFSASSNGNVGIGITNPGYNLDVVGTVRATSSVTVGVSTAAPTSRTMYTITTPGDTMANPGAGSYYGHSLQLSAGSITGSMWTGTPTTYGPDLVLTAGSATDIANNGTANATLVGGNLYLQGGLASYPGGVAYAPVTTAGGIIFQTGPTSGSITTANATLTERMRVHTNGYVGIATTNPTVALDVNGGVHVSAGNLVRVEGTATAVGSNVFSIGGYGQLLIDAPNVAGGRFIITDAGKVGIGVTNPSYPLHVSGVANTGSKTYSYLTLNSVNGSSLTSSYSGSGASGAGWSAYFTNTVLAQEFNAISDARIKTDIKSVETDAILERVAELDVREYSYIDVVDKGSRRKIGFVAQEVEGVFPEFVTNSTEYVPNVFVPALRTENVPNGVVLVLPPRENGYDVAVGDKLKMSTTTDAIVYATVKDVSTSGDGEFELTVELADPDKPLGATPFVIGKQVDDFRTINFEQLTAVAVAGVQSLSERVRQKDREIALLKEQIDAIKKHVGLS